MTSLSIHLDGDGCWPDVAELRERGRLIDAMGSGTSVEVAVLTRGTTGGRESITFRVNLEDGRVLLFETTWRLLHTTARAIEGRYGEPR